MSTEEIDREQQYVSMLYGRLDGLREETAARLAEVLREPGGTHQARAERDSAIDACSAKLTRFGAMENRLCFGRLDLQGDERRYIGRLGILDESKDYEPLLMDWRAPAARPFYLATAASPDGVNRRRHIKTHGRRVVDLDDEVLDLTAADVGSRAGLTGEAALFAALNASRTGRMGDIVETIQAEQDRIICADHDGVLVVQGGPGTGKTAVALHRAAYLLYTHRQNLSKRGVLIVGPNATFMRYIGQVLPSLGETGVMLATVGELFPGVDAQAVESPEAAEVKGRPTMADVVAAAVRDRQWAPEEAYEVVFERETLRLDRATCVDAQERARQSLQPHNEARPIFVAQIIDALAKQITDRVGANVVDEANLLNDQDVEAIRRDLHDDADVMAALDELWPVLTPQQLLSELFSSPDRLASAAPELTAAERALLLRDVDAGWTAADVPLLDEAAELLGVDDRVAQALAERERREQIAFAQGVLDLAEESTTFEFEDEESEILEAHDLLDADQLAERHAERSHASVAERAAADRTWTFGHVIVDEAQELSAMTWRLLMRRCPSRSMTLVGDIAQTSDLAGASSWEGMLAPYVADRWRLERLTVNYRTPAEIMAVAADVLATLAAAAEVGLQAPRSVRETGVQPWRWAAPSLTDALPALVAREAAAIGDGRLAVLLPASRFDELAGAVAAALPDAAVGEDPELEKPVVVLSVRQAKGLEFDAVLVVEPAQILADGPRGMNDLYVALTRTTQRLGVVHTGETPAVLSRLSPLVAVHG